MINQKINTASPKVKKANSGIIFAVSFKSNCANEPNKYPAPPIIISTPIAFGKYPSALLSFQVGKAKTPAKL